ncbi:MAG: DnaA/Hda family protein [Pseudomonadota bacterium]
MDDVSRHSDHLDIYRNALISRFGEATYRSWMSDIDVERADDGEVALSTASRLRHDKLIQRFKPGMHDEWNRRFEPAKKFSILLRARDSVKRAAQAAPAEGVAAPHASGGDAKGAQTKTAFTDRAPAKLSEFASELDVRSTFGAFAVDDTNRIAHAAARKAISSSGAQNPIYIYGPSGVGKTHLLHAVGNAWRAEKGDADFAYLTHAGLTNGCVDAVWSNSVPTLHKDLLSQRLLLIDDIHLLSGKNRTQQEVLNMVNAFISSGRQLVIAGEAAPSRLRENGLNARLADRLAGGLAVPVEPGSVGLRTQVLKMLAAREETTCTFEDAAIDFVAAQFPQSMREAIGAFNQLALVYGEQDIAVGEAEARAALRSRLSDVKRVGTLDDGVAAAADAFGITVEDVKGRAQPQRIVKARHAFVYVSREVLKESFPRIAAVLGRDHTTAMSSYRRAEALLERNEAFREAVRKISAAVGG